jgi:hypothetical protein
MSSALPGWPLAHGGITESEKRWCTLSRIAGIKVTEFVDESYVAETIGIFLPPRVITV